MNYQFNASFLFLIDSFTFFMASLGLNFCTEIQRIDPSCSSFLLKLN